MNDYKIAVLTYNVKHRKTYDTLCLLKSRGYEVTVYAQPMTYVKKRQPMVQHRPELIMDIPELPVLCKNFGFELIEGEFASTIGYENDRDSVIYLLCGAGLLQDEFIQAHRIVNGHPGFIPYARGLDAYKWSIYNGLPIGVTTHFLGDYVDAGEVIERRPIEVHEFDTFHSVSQRIYENEIDMIVGAIDKIDEEHEMIVPPEDSVVFKRMPEGKEQELFERFEEHKRKSAEKDKYMDILNLNCKDIIQKLQVFLGLQSVSITFDDMDETKRRMEARAHTIYLNVMDNLAEQERYESKIEEAQEKYKTKSPVIHFPNLTVWQVIEIFKADVTGAYERTCEYLESIQMKGECPVELRFILNVFLHEVGHWKQLTNIDRHVKTYMEMDRELEEANHNESAKLSIKLGEMAVAQQSDTPKIPKKVMEELVRLEEEYRKIPKEADADKYAREVLQEMDIGSFMRMLGEEKVEA